MPRARLAPAFVLAGLVLWAAAPALGQASPSPEERSAPRDLIVFSGDVIVHRGEDVGEVVVLHGTASIAGVVHGDVVVVDGRIEVAGQVSGSVVSINGPVDVGPNAQILGDVIGRDRVTIAEGARIGSPTNAASPSPPEASGDPSAAPATASAPRGAKSTSSAPRASVETTTASHIA